MGHLPDKDFLASSQTVYAFQQDQFIKNGSDQLSVVALN
jgi:hypothetical protein